MEEYNAAMTLIESIGRTVGRSSRGEAQGDVEPPTGAGSAPVRWIVAVALTALAMEGASLVMLIPNSAAFTLAQFGFNGVGGIVLGVTYPVIGWLIASRQPRNPIGWIFLIVGLSQASTGFFGQYAAYGLVTRPGSLPGADLASWVGAWSWAPGFAGLFLMLLVFPDGRLPSPRWRPILGLGLVSGGTVTIANAVGSWGFRGRALLIGSSPDTTSDPVLGLLMAAVNLGLILLGLVGLAAIVSLAVRFRRAGVIERQQIKWFTAAAALEVVLLLLTILISIPYPFDLLAAILVVPLVPIATVVAILRYRLYAIDRIVSRSISYLVVVAILAAVFVAVVLSLQRLLSSFTDESPVAVAGSTLVAFALFQPLLRRVQRRVDRRFDRSRYEADRAIAGFAGRLRDVVDLAAVRSEVLDLVDSTIRPTQARLWIRGPEESVGSRDVVTISGRAAGTTPP